MPPEINSEKWTGLIGPSSVLSFFANRGGIVAYRKSNPGVHSDPDAAAATSVPSCGAGAGTDEAGDDTGTGAGESASIVLGEITAYRCWNVSSGLYRSLNGTVWFPDEPMSGEGIALENSSGVYAFRSRADAEHEAKRYGSALAVGSVKMWGTIVEHEKGYRAEFAKIDQIFSNAVSEYSVAALRQEKARGPAMAKALAEDCASYKFRCERYGDFLSVLMERRGKKFVCGINLADAAAIVPINGEPARSGRVEFKIWKSDGDVHLYRPDADYGARVEMVHIPTFGKEENLLHQDFSTDDDTIGIDDCPIAAADDQVRLSSGVIIFAPHGCGRKIYQQILDTIRAEPRGPINIVTE